MKTRKKRRAGGRVAIVPILKAVAPLYTAPWPYRNRFHQLVVHLKHIVGIRLGDLAKRTGTEEQSIQKWLDGNVVPNPSELAGFCIALKVPISLFGIHEVPAEQAGEGPIYRYGFRAGNVTAAEGMVEPPIRRKRGRPPKARQPEVEVVKRGPGRPRKNPDSAPVTRPSIADSSAKNMVRRELFLPVETYNSLNRLSLLLGQDVSVLLVRAMERSIEEAKSRVLQGL